MTTSALHQRNITEVLLNNDPSANREELPDGACFLIKLPKEMKDYINKVQEQFDQETQVDESKGIENELLLQNIFDKENQRLGQRDQAFDAIEDDQLSLNSEEIDILGPEKAKQLAVQRVKDAWKIDIGHLIVSDDLNIGAKKSNIQICLQNNDIEGQMEPQHMAKVFEVFNDAENHPVFNPIVKKETKTTQVMQNKSFTNKQNESLDLDKNQLKRGATDAYVLRSKFRKKRDSKNQIKMEHRLYKTLRLKPTNLDTKTIMENFLKEKPKIKQYKPTKVDHRQNIASKIYIIPEDDDNDNQSKSNDSDGPNLVGGNRYAKPEEELMKDILNLFKIKDMWTMDEIKAEMPDQPDRPVEQLVKKLCKTQGNQTGRYAQYILNY